MTAARNLLARVALDAVTPESVVYRGESVRVDAAAVSDHVQSIVDQGLPCGGAMREGYAGRPAVGGAKRRPRL